LRTIAEPGTVEVPVAMVRMPFEHELLWLEYDVPVFMVQMPKSG
jgi:hypothetical protein